MHIVPVRPLAFLLAALLLLGACAPPRQASPDPTRSAAVASSAAEVDSRRGGRLVLGTFADARVLNPVLATDVTSRDVLSRIYESLITLDPKTGQPRPRLAERFEQSADGTTLSFTLREGLVWSDGSAFMGDDFAFTAEAVMRSQTTVRKNIFQDVVGAKEFGQGQAEHISGIEVDGRSITVRLERPSCPALTSIGLFGILPRSVFGKYLDPADPSRNLDNAPENTAPPLAMGPFTFKEWQPNDRLVLERNERFFLGPAHLDELVLRVYPDTAGAAAALRTGEVDAYVVEPRDADDLKQEPSLRSFSYLSPGYTFLGWNQLRGGKEFFQSKSVRQALAYGLNLQQVVDTLLAGEGRRMVAQTPPASWAYDPSELNQYPYDPHKARQLLEQDGWSRGEDGIYQKNGRPLEFTLVTEAGHRTMETLLQVAVEQYREIGVRVVPRTEALEALVDRVVASRDPAYGDQGGRDFDAVILGWVLGVDPDDAYTLWHSSQIQAGLNIVGFQDPALDQALEEGRSRCGLEDRQAAYRKVDRILNEAQPYNFGLTTHTLLFVHQRFQGVDPGPFGAPGYLWNVEEWWIKE